MSVPTRTIIGVLVSSLLADSVLAGITTAPVARTAIPEAERPNPPAITLTLCGREFSPLVGVSIHEIARVRADLHMGVAEPGSADAVVSLPPGPGSASLVACGLALLSAVGGLRSLRKAHFGPLPEWYSTYGPRQIGCATPLDLESPAFLQRAFETVDPAVTFDSVEPIDVDLSPQLAHIALARPRAPPDRR